MAIVFTTWIAQDVFMAGLVRKLPSPPYNPGVRDLVQGKKAWDARATPARERAGFRGWHERGYLPHRDSPGLTQFITWHLADAFPAELRGEWQALLEIEKEPERRKQLEAYLDKGCGAAWLRRPEFARICQEALRHFDGQRYRLLAWCLMPNHVHVLVLILSAPMSATVKNWKGYTARRCNQLLATQVAPGSTRSANQSFWADGYWDTYTRDADHVARCVRYIENNPVKAGLVRIPSEWPWSSARFHQDPARGHSCPQQ